MKKDVKRKWLKALESGEYEQATNALESDGRFCCLGVLCDIAAKEGVVERKVEGAHVLYGNSLAVLPKEVMEWAGIYAVNPSLPYAKKRGHRSLASLNDNGVSFKKIANLIRRYL